MFKSLNVGLKSIEDKITLLGRTAFGEEGELRLSWSASGFCMKFVGAAVALSVLPYLSANGDDESKRYVSVKLEIDGVAHKSCVSSERELIFADGLEDTEHILRIFKVSESDEPLRLSEIQVVGAAPTVLPYKPEYNFKMEVVGDSITCGYGAYRAISTGFSAFEEDATVCYAHLAAERMGAELRLISYSGKGFIRDCGGSNSNRFIDFFRRSERTDGFSLHDFTAWQPDVLVINGGTNDAGRNMVSDGEFREGVVEFYRFARSVYPKAKILFFYGAMRHTYSDVYSELVSELRKTDPNVYYRLVGTVDAEKNEVAVSGHPSFIGQRRLGEELVLELSSIL